MYLTQHSNKARGPTVRYHCLSKRQESSTQLSSSNSLFWYLFLLSALVHVEIPAEIQQNRGPALGRTKYRDKEVRLGRTGTREKQFLLPSAVQEAMCG